MELVDEVISQLDEYCNGLSDDLQKLDRVFRKYMEADNAYRENKADDLGLRGLNIIKYNKRNDCEYYYIFSFLFQATKNKEIYKLLLQFTICDEDITKETKYFLFNQFRRYQFVNSDIIDAEAAELYDDLYSHIYEAYKEEFQDIKCSFIPKEERNADFVLVLVTQVVGIGHGPTKTLLDRCYVLEEALHKKVYIINTAEFMTTYQWVPYFDMGVPTYIDEFSSVRWLSYKEKQFPFLQCPKEMPQVSVIKEIIDVVLAEKPYFILTIGGGSVISDICSNIVPTLCVSTVFSGRTETRGQFQSIARRITEDDKRWLNKHNLPEDHIIEGLFNFAFVEQTHSYTRKELGLPENRFIVIIVGLRLDTEIDGECIKLLQRLMNAGIFIVFMGVFGRYREYVERYPDFGENSSYLEFQDDPLAVNECCDLYLNPKRTGGGGSAAEALYKGLPVVTCSFGDVGVSAGEAFHVKDYDEMFYQVIKYYKDKAYYYEMSKKAVERGKLLTDSTSEFVRIIKKMEHSQRF